MTRPLDPNALADVYALADAFLAEVEQWDECVPPCDHCGAPADALLVLSVWVHSHLPVNGVAVPTRVNSGRWWTFCSASCRQDWYAAPAREDFHPLGCVEGFLDEDVLLRASAWHVEYDRSRSVIELSPEDLQVTLVDEHVAPTGAELNRWWRGEAPSRAPLTK